MAEEGARSVRRHGCSIGPGRCPHDAVVNLGPDDGGPYACAGHLLLRVGLACGLPFDYAVEAHRRLLRGEEIGA